MEFHKIFLSPNGRISRRQFWLGHAMILGATVVLSLVGGFVAGILSTLPGFEGLRVWGPVMIGGGVAVLALVAEITLAVKRMHDRDASGLWVVGVVVVALIANLLIGGEHIQAGESPITPLTVGLSVFTMIMGGWLIIELGFIRGTEGENRYGSEPAVSVKVQGGENTPMLTDGMVARKGNAA
ncbi:MAG TPA: DUF805 domain-containing protein [Hyphomicrobiales bacterium]|nr:DUF805 domain-containing protein [Hyphomicrobiales bacterium]